MEASTDSTASLQSDWPHTTAPKWQAGRPTLIDATLLFAAAALSIAAVSSRLLGGRSGGDWQAFVCACWVFAATLSAPVVIGGQYLRGRRALLGVGEGLWLLPASLWIAVAFASCLAPDSVMKWLFLAALVAQVLCGCAALLYIPFPKNARPYWTDWVGAWVGLATLAACAILVRSA